MRYSMLISFLLGFVLNTIAQSPYYQQYTERDGLIGMNVYQVIQDNNGMIWITTDNGICYFDGNEFKVMSHPKMKDLDFIGMYKAPDNRIWFWNWTGQVFYLNKNKLEHYSPEGYLDSLSIRFLFGDESGNIWMRAFESRGELIYCSHGENCIKRPCFFEDEIPDLLDVFKENTTKKSTMIWWDYFVSVNSKITRLEDNKILTLFDPNGSLGYNPYKYGLFYIGRNSNTLESLAFENNEFFSKKEISIPKNRKFRDIFVDKSNDTWVLSDANIYLFDEYDQPKSINIPVIENKIVNTIYQDTDGGYWFGTRDEGLFYVPNKNVIIRNNENSKLSSNNIREYAKNNLPTFVVFAVNFEIPFF